MTRAVIVALLLLLAPLAAQAGACTPGTDCFCDCTRQTSPSGACLAKYPGLTHVTTELLCEDFEEPPMYVSAAGDPTQYQGDGPPYYGPPYDANTGGLCANWTYFRGCNSYWNRSYGTPGGSHLMASGTPTNPTYGQPCTAGGGECMGKWWTADNRWNANSYAPGTAYFTSASDFTAEDPTMTAPTATQDGNPGVFDGNANYVNRIPAGGFNSIHGSKNFGGNFTDVGYTIVVAYPNNSAASGIWGVGGGQAWKHDEWSNPYVNFSGGDGPFIFYNQTGPFSGRPFAGFYFTMGGAYNGTILDQTKGSWYPNVDSALIWNIGSTDDYSQTVDWPEGTWGCVRGHMVISGGQFRTQIWFQGPNMTSERLIIDGTATLGNLQIGYGPGVNGYIWDAYPNANQGGGVPTTELTFRYEDNVIVKEGTPLTCAQIGYTGAGEPPPAGGSSASGSYHLGWLDWLRTKALPRETLVGLGMLRP